MTFSSLKDKDQALAKKHGFLCYHTGFMSPVKCVLQKKKKKSQKRLQLLNTQKEHEDGETQPMFIKMHL